MFLQKWGRKPARGLWTKMSFQRKGIEDIMNCGTKSTCNRDPWNQTPGMQVKSRPWEDRLFPSLPEGRGPLSLSFVFIDPQVQKNISLLQESLLASLMTNGNQSPASVWEVHGADWRGGPRFKESKTETIMEPSLRKKYKMTNTILNRGPWSSRVLMLELPYL